MEASNSEKQIVIPRHIGIIMDGNGRWAQKRGLPRTAGHVKGADVFQKITRYCEKIGVKAVTVFAFSTENWKRPQDEVDSIMNLLRQYIGNAFSFKGENIKITFWGDRSRLLPDIVSEMERLESVSAANDGLFLNICVNYGGRDEIVMAARSIAQKVAAGEMTAEDVDESSFSAFLYSAGQPEVDMILRPSGEHRISNFLLWQCAYSEFVYMDTLWPDFTPKKLDKAIEEFSARKRRFGGI